MGSDVARLALNWQRLSPGFGAVGGIVVLVPLKQEAGITPSSRPHLRH